MPGLRLGARRELAYLLLIALLMLTAACQTTTGAATEQWTPPYLELHLFAGKAEVQWTDASESTVMEGKTSVAIEDKGRIVTGAAEGAQFYLGDGSTLELAPETTIEVRNPRTFAHLQVIVEYGSLLFFAQQSSYEFVIPECSVTFLTVPAMITIEVDGETTRLAVEEGAVNCETETKTLTLPTCREVYIRPGEEIDVAEFCAPSTVASPYTPTAIPASSGTPSGTEQTETPTPSPTPTSTPIATPTSTYIPATPTATPPPPPPTEKPKKTKPKPTQPPPEPTQPPPDPTEPPPPPTEPPRPTEPPSTKTRPTVPPPT